MLLNCDMGENEDLWFDGTHQDLIKLVDQVSISCGAHAGSDRLIKETIESAVENNKTIGAHPSYPDRKNFGRKSLNAPLFVILESIKEQLLWFKKSCAELGATISYVKPHGALYHDLHQNDELRKGVISAMKELEINVPLMLMADTNLSINYIREAFIDRVYSNGSKLVSRTEQNSVISKPNLALEQYVSIVERGEIETLENGIVPIFAKSCCIHSDNRNALEIASLIVKYKVK